MSLGERGVAPGVPKRPASPRDGIVDHGQPRGRWVLLSSVLGSSAVFVDATGCMTGRGRWVPGPGWERSPAQRRRPRSRSPSPSSSSRALTICAATTLAGS